MTAAGEAKGVLSMAITASQGSTGVRSGVDDGAFRVEALTKVHGNGIRANDAISLRVEPGEVFGLLGSKGAGKSTLVQAGDRATWRKCETDNPLFPM